MRFLDGVQCNIERFKVMNLINSCDISNHVLCHLKVVLQLDSRKPEEMEFETRLYICKGKRVVHVKQIQFFRSLLNHDDVFILDTKEKIFQFIGANSNIQERAKALEVIQYLKDTYHEMMENYKRKVIQVNSGLFLEGLLLLARSIGGSGIPIYSISSSNIISRKKHI
ncbi:unnamed protein product [Lactuca virosa]|uniref:Gelsolin-like domain-containing protein n=1 Tax=Lactuca virosa TaxID=75947 RepID=A0AAU9NCI5_9ASTR|nr:unnamed protein product [Lactuca virosa]